MSSGLDCEWTSETINPWVILTMKAWWLISVLCFRIQKAFKPVTLDGLDRHIFYKEKRRVTGRCPTDMYELKIPHTLQ